MTKHARKSNPLQAVDLPKTMAVEIPLPLLEAFGSIESSFFELCIDSGQQVLQAMMEQDREDLCGPRWKRDPERSAGRAGTTRSEVTLGGRRIAIPRPRVRSMEGEEMELPSFAFASKRDPLDRHTLNAVACGISSRKNARSLDPLPDGMQQRSTSKSAVSRRYITMTTKQMTSWLTTPLGDRHFPIIMIDGIHMGDHLVLIALGIDFEGKKQVLGLREGDTENGQVARALLRDLVDRGLEQERARVFVIDGAKALTSAIVKIFGPLAKIQRCQIHKRRNILGHLPDRLHENVKAVLKEAWGLWKCGRGQAQTRTSGLFPQSRPSRRSRVRARRTRRDAHTSETRRRRHALQEASQHERDRESEQWDRHLLEEREALAGRQDGHPLGQCCDRRSGEEVPSRPRMA